DDSYTLHACGSLASCLIYQGELAASEAIRRHVLDGFRKTGEKAPLVAAHENLAGCLILHYKCDKYLEAEALLRQALDIASANFGEKHALTAGCYGELAEVLNLQQRYADAAAAARKSIDIHEACGAKDPKAPKAYEALATALECQGHYEQAALLRRK